MRVLLTTYGSRGGVQPLVGLAVQVRALGAEVQVCAPPDQEFAELLAGVGVPLVPIGQPVRPPVTKATPPSADLPPRAAELVAAQFDTVVAAAEECDASVATGVMSTGGSAMTEHALVIAGGGPTGLMLAGELALAGVDVAIVERRASPELIGSRAGGLHSRTIEVLDQRGIADRFLSQGQVAQVVRFHMIPLDISDFPTRHNYGLGLWQNQIERILADWVGELAVTIYRGREVTSFAQDDTGVDVALSDGQSLRAEYLVGCDGGRSLIRKAAGIEFPGWDPTTSWLIAEIEMAEEPKWGFHQDPLGIHALSRLENGGPVRVVLTERQIGPASEPTLRDLSEALIAVYGTDYGIHSPTWISRFTDMTRQAAAYRDRRVLLAGDAAHVHPRWVDRASTSVCRMR